MAFFAIKLEQMPSCCTGANRNARQQRLQNPHQLLWHRELQAPWAMAKVAMVDVSKKQNFK